MAFSASSTRRYRRTSSTPTNVGRHAAAPATSHSKPAWDSTVSDIHSLRASTAELERRRIIHQSHNVGLTPTTTRQAPQSSASSTSLVSTSDNGRNLTIGEKAFSAVRDLFGDDPKTYSGPVHATPTPAVPRHRSMRHGRHSTADASNSSSLFNSSNSALSPLAALNDSTVTGSAVALDSSTGILHGTSSSPNRLGQRRIAAETPQGLMPPRVSMSQSEAAHDTEGSTSVSSYHDRDQLTDGSPTAMVQCGADGMAESFVQRLDRISGSVALLSATLSSSQALPTGKENLSPTSQPSLQGHTGLLLETLLMLTSCLKENTIRSEQQEQERQHLTQVVQHQQILLDGLASDMLSIQETQKGALRRYAHVEHTLQELQAEVSESLRQTTDSFRQLVEGTRMYQSLPNHR